MEDHPCAVLYGYHPEHLVYSLVREEYSGPDHPRDTDGPLNRAVGVHRVQSALSWDSGPAGVSSGFLSWHEVSLSDWTGTRVDFAKATPEEQAEALRIGPMYGAGKWGTHLGATLALATGDGYTVLRSRAGKYAEETSFDSLVAGTLLVKDVPSSLFTTSDYLEQLVVDANLGDGGVLTEFHPTHLAMRRADFGLWIGGWAATNLTAREIAELVPFDTEAVPLDREPRVPLTPWGQFDLDMMRVHLAGGLVRDPMWLP